MKRLNKSTNKKAFTLLEVLLAVAIGGSLWGIFGLLIGLPLVSVFYTILRDDVNNRLKDIEVV